MSERKNTAIERALLTLLVSGGSRKQEILASLRSYRFRSIEHQVLYDCLAGMPLDRPELIRELLPARLVRAGFPDFDIDPFLNDAEAGEVGDEEAGRLCRELINSQTAVE